LKTNFDIGDRVIAQGHVFTISRISINEAGQVKYCDAGSCISFLENCVRKYTQEAVRNMILANLETRLQDQDLITVKNVLDRYIDWDKLL